MSHTQRLSFSEFRRKFTDESSCKNYLYMLRFPHGFVCPRCGCTTYSFIKTRGGKFQCSGCKKQTSLTSGTVMHRTHLPMTTWFWAIYLVAVDKRGISATQLAKELELSYETAWYLLLRIRRAMSQRDCDYLLSGIVEMDDSYFGGGDAGGKRGRGTSKINVMVALSKGEDGKPNFLKMRIMENLKHNMVESFAKATIQEGSTIQSDAYRSYQKALAQDYNHEYEVFDSSKEMLHWLHIVVGNAKAFILGTYHGNCRVNLQAVLDEFCYRFNRRMVSGELFSRLLNAVSNSNILGSAVLNR